MSKKSKQKVAPPAPATPAAQKSAPDALKVPNSGVSPERLEKAPAAEARSTPVAPAPVAKPAPVAPAPAAKPAPVTAALAAKAAPPVAAPELKPAVSTVSKAVAPEASKPLAVASVTSLSASTPPAAVASVPHRTEVKPVVETPSAKPAPARRTVDVTFVFEDPNARQVSLCGAFNDWAPGATPMKPQSAGRWQAIVALPLGVHEYKFVVDGQWRPDPKAKQSAPNPHGTVNSVIEVKI